MGTFVARVDLEIKDKKGAENLAANHVSWLENASLEPLEEESINDIFPNERLLLSWCY